MIIAPSQAVSVVFLVKNERGVLVAADATPTCAVLANGAVTPMAVTVTALAGTGTYKASWTDDGNQAIGSPVQLSATALIGGEGTGYTAIVWEGIVGRHAPPNFTSLGINASGHLSRVTLVDTTTANTDMRGTDSAALATSLTASETAILAAMPANFAALGINASGHVSRVVLVDTTTTNTDVTALAANWTPTRAGYLDNLNVGGVLASQADVQAVTQASRVRIAVPPQMERPEAGTTAYRLWIYNYDELHQANDLDAVPTVTVEDHLGTDLSAGLGVVTKQALTTGIYYVDYSVAAADAVGGLIFKVDATEETVTTQYVATSVVVGATSVDFTAADRTKLEAMHAKLPSSAYLLGTAAADGSGYSTHSAADAATATRTELATELARIDVAVSSRGTFTATVGATAGFEHFFNVATPAQTMNDFASIGEGATLVQVTVLDDSAVPVQSAKVNIYDSTGGTLGIYAHTDTMGVATFYLDDGDYQAGIASMSGFNGHTPQAFTVSAAGLVGGLIPVALTFERTAPVVASDPALCVVKCYVMDAGGQPVEGVTISASPVNRALTVPTKIITLIASTATTDALGYAEMELPRADAIDSTGSKAYRFYVRNNGTGVYDVIEKEIPSAGETTLAAIVNG